MSIVTAQQFADTIKDFGIPAFTDSEGPYSKTRDLDAFVIIFNRGHILEAQANFRKDYEDILIKVREAAKELGMTETKTSGLPLSSLVFFARVSDDGKRSDEGVQEGNSTSSKLAELKGAIDERSKRAANTITVKVCGVTGSGKTVVMGIVQRALQQAGLDVVEDPASFKSPAAQVAMDTGTVPEGLKSRRVVLEEVHVNRTPKVQTLAEAAVAERVERSAPSWPAPVKTMLAEYRALAEHDRAIVRVLISQLSVENALVNRTAIAAARGKVGVVLTGPPGCGKTTVGIIIKALLQNHEVQVGFAGYPPAVEKMILKEAADLKFDNINAVHPGISVTVSEVRT